jgi:protein-disulfide isomerase
METGEVVKLKNLVSDKDHTLGPPDAVITLLEYGNFECVDCGRAFPSIRQIRQLLREKLRFVYRHFPTVRTYPHSMRAAEAAEAAGAQGRFWEMHDELFTHQHALEDAHLMRYARNIGLNLEQFARDLNEHSFLKEIQEKYQLSLFDEHITGTPTIYINSVRHTGPTDIESLLLAIRNADTDNAIALPETGKGLRRWLQRLHRQPR